MTRRVLAALVLLAVVAGAILASRRLLERVPVPVRRGASLEVRRQPRLAFERLLAAGEVDVDRIDLAADALPRLSTDSLLMLDEAAVDLSRGVEMELVRWVERGGTLVLSPVGAEAGALSARFGIHMRGTRDEDAPSRAQPLDRIEVGVPGRSTRFHLSPVDGFLLEGRPVWSAGDGTGGFAIAALAHGEGRVVAVAGLSSMWHNDRIGHHDHAAFLWALTRIAGDRAPVLLTDVAVPELSWTAVARRGWPVLLSAAVLGVLSLWRVLPRMGPVLTPAAPERRQLREHLEALGRFHVKEHRFAALSSAARRAIQQRLARQPWQRRPSDEAALTAHPDTPAQFLQTVQRLHAVWRRLHRA